VTSRRSPTWRENGDASFDPWPYGIALLDTNAELRDLTIRKSPDVGGSGFVVNGGAPRISGITYTGESDFGNVYVHGGSRAVISDSDFGPMWVFFEEASPATIENSKVDGAIRLHTNSAVPTDEPQVVRGNTVGAIMLRGNVLIEGNKMDGALTLEDEGAVAIDVDNGDVVISDNEVSRYQTGITVHGPGSATIRGNTLIDNDTAIVDGATSDQLIEGNTVSGGGGGGIFVTGSGTSTISGNTVEGVSRRGIGLSSNGSFVLSGNRACGNGEDLWVSDGATATIDDTNEFCVIAPSG